MHERYETFRMRSPDHEVKKSIVGVQVATSHSRSVFFFREKTAQVPPVSMCLHPPSLVYLMSDGCPLPECTHVTLLQIGQNLSDPFDMEYPSLEEAAEVQWGSLKDRWGPVPRPFVVAQGKGLHQLWLSSNECSCRVCANVAGTGLAWWEFTPRSSRRHSPVALAHPRVVCALRFGRCLAQSVLTGRSVLAREL